MLNRDASAHEGWCRRFHKGKTVTQQDGHKVEVHTTEKYGGTVRDTFVDGSQTGRAFQKDGVTHEYGKLENGKPSDTYKK